MATTLLTTLFADLSDDLRDSRLLLQVASLLICCVLTWISARFFKKLFNQNEASSGVLHLVTGSFARVLWPAFLALYISIARELLSRWEHTHLLTLLLPIAASLALIRFGFYVVRRTFARDGQVRGFWSLFEKFFATLVWLGMVLHFTGLAQDLFAFLDNTLFPIGRNKISILNMLQALASVLITLILALWASAALEARLMLLPTMHTSLKVVFSRLGRAALILIALLVSLTIVGIDLTVLSVFGGALGVGLGLGLQKITSSYVSGFIILLDRSMSIGDNIVVDKFSGKVTQINTRYTVLKGADGGEAVIPNEMLVSNPVQNYSLSDSSVVLHSDIIVAYKTDLSVIMPLLAQTVISVPRVLAEPLPSVLLMKFGSDGLELRVNFWIGDPEKGRGNVLSEVNLALWIVLKQNNIELPYAQRVVTLLNPSAEFSDESLKKA